MVLLHVLLLLGAPSPDAVKVPQLVKLLEEKKREEAVALLREIAGMRDDHAEAKALVRMVRNPDVPKTPEVVEATFLALKGIGSRQVTRDVVALLEHSELKKDPAVRIGVCRALEGSADPAGVEALVGCFHDVEDRVIAAAAEAAAAYRHAGEAVRKELFKEVLEVYVPTWNLKNSVDPERKVEKARAERKWAVVSGSMEKALQLLSNANEPTPPAWQRWWNKNKKKRWTLAEMGN
jgi:hypothetical protein